jgi:hypothetical protein
MQTTEVNSTNIVTFTFCSVIFVHLYTLSSVVCSIFLNQECRVCADENWMFLTTECDLLWTVWLSWRCISNAIKTTRIISSLVVWELLCKVKVKFYLCLTKHHTMKVLLTSEVERGEWSALHPGHFTPRERAPSTHWIGAWVGPRASMDAVERWKIPSPHWELNPWIPIIQPIPSCYTDWATPALNCYVEHGKFKWIW